MSVGIHFNLILRLKTEVGGSKIAGQVTVYKRSIFQVEWLIAALITIGKHFFANGSFLF